MKNGKRDGQKCEPALRIVAYRGGRRCQGIGGHIAACDRKQHEPAYRPRREEGSREQCQDESRWHELPQTHLARMFLQDPHLPVPVLEVLVP